MAEIKNKTMLEVVIPKGSDLTMPLAFQQDAAHHVWVDWGDKSYPDTYAYQGLVEAKHKYPAAGTYTITMYTVDDGWLILGGGWTGSNLVGGGDEAAARMLTTAYIGDDVVGIAAYAFRGCENLTTLTIPKTKEISIGAFAFEGCNSLESVHLPDSVTTVPRNCFCDCTNLKTVELAKGTYEIEPRAFYGCSNLSSINLQSVAKIDDYAFAFCRKLTDIALGAGAFKIGDGAFNSCSCVRNITLGGTKTIGDEAFYGAKSLQTLEFTDKVTSIGRMAFAACSSLKTIKMATGNPPVLMAANSIEHNDGMKILIPKGSIRTYINATNWALFDGDYEEV